MKFVYLFFFLGFLNCFESRRDCHAFKTGTYKSEVIINGILYQSKFTRTKDLQIEMYNNKIDSSKIRWLNDCEVVFKTINPKNMLEKKDIHLKILTTTNSSYTYEYSYVGDIIKQKGIAYKLD